MTKAEDAKSQGKGTTKAGTEKPRKRAARSGAGRKTSAPRKAKGEQDAQERPATAAPVTPGPAGASAEPTMAQPAPGQAGPEVFADGPYQHMRLARPAFALGLASSYLAYRRPFAALSAQEFVGTLMGEIRRRHYLLSFDQNGICGYVGWGLCDYQTALDYAHARRTPGFEECIGGDTFTMLTIATAGGAVIRSQRRILERLYPDYPIVARRIKNGQPVGKVVRAPKARTQKSQQANEERT